MKVLVMLGGTPPSKKILYKYLKESNYVIAADSGAKILIEESLDIDLLLGDFDSLEEEFKGLLKTSKIKSYKKEKDFTDGYAAMIEAIKLKPNLIYLLGATGTRVDHFLANLNLLKLALNKEIRAELIDDHNKCFLINKPCEIKKENSFISFSAFTKEVTNFTLKNFKYKLENHTLFFGESLTVSNEFLEDNGEVYFDEGTVLVMYSKD